MELSSKRKVLVAVLSVGLAGLAIDRFVLDSGLSGPAEAAADTALPTEASTNVDSAMQDLRAASRVRTPVVVAGRLQELAGQPEGQVGLVAGMFEPSPEAWGIEELDPVPEPTTISALEFLSKYRLNAVMVGGASPLAVVSGEAMTIGQALEGYVLTELDEDGVVFVSPLERVELQLDRPVDDSMGQ